MESCPKCKRIAAFLVLEDEIVCTKCGHRIPRTELSKEEEKRFYYPLSEKVKKCCGEEDESKNQ